MAKRNRSVRVLLAAVAMAIVSSGCTSSDTGETEVGISTEGDADGGSFVGVPAGASFSGAGTDPDTEIDPDAEIEADAATDAETDVEADGDGEMEAEVDIDGEQGESDPTGGSGESSVLGADSGSELNLSTDADVVFFPGTCFGENPAGGDAIELGCDEPHEIEVYGVVDLPGGAGAPFQGFDEASDLCNVEFMAITGVGLGLATIYRRSVLRPSEDTWADGERDVTCYVAYPAPTTRSILEIDPVRDFGLVSIYGLEVGDCFVDFDDTESTFTWVSCDEPHDAEVFIDFDYPAGSYPGDEEIDARSEELCFGQPFEDFVGRDYQTSAVFALRSRPNLDTWSEGDRAINCILTDELVREGSFEGTGL